MCAEVFFSSGCDMSTGWRGGCPGPPRWCDMARGEGAFRGTLVVRGVQGGEGGTDRPPPLKWTGYGVDDSSSEDAASGLRVHGG